MTVSELQSGRYYLEQTKPNQKNTDLKIKGLLGSPALRDQLGDASDVGIDLFDFDSDGDLDAFITDIGQDCICVDRLIEGS